MARDSLDGEILAILDWLGEQRRRSDAEDSQTWAQTWRIQPQSRVTVQCTPSLISVSQWLATQKTEPWTKQWSGELYPAFPVLLGAAKGLRAEGRPPSSPYLPLPP